MGVYRTDYLFFGIKVDPDKVEFDRDEDILCGEPNRPFDMVFDGMSGKYAVVGQVIAKSDPHEGLEFTEITPDMLPSDPEAMMEKITGRFGEQFEKPRLFLFSHFA